MLTTHPQIKNKQHFSIPKNNSMIASTNKLRTNICIKTRRTNGISL
uniref:Uncharacterized protein n=1 Tax=Rhizophora mucronata TaxID=61149 RepID=A0A2P2N702_RHIMU